MATAAPPGPGNKPAAAPLAKPAGLSPQAASQPSATQRAATPPPPAAEEAPPAQQQSERLMSLDAYRGFIMLAMASSALGFVQVAAKPEVRERFAGTSWDASWRWLWETLAYQFEHVAWTGCAFWDLIQPSFMFMVGVAVPFSNARRTKLGQPAWLRWLHVLWRAAVLVALGVFLSSNGAPLTNFTFVNVLTQIGLGYPLLYLVSEKSGRTENTNGWLKFQLAAVVAILAGYSAWFVTYSLPEDERAGLEAALAAANKTEPESTRFGGLAAPWSKHVNAAAGVDRQLLNRFPRAGDTPEKRRFWYNDGGYQTLNFVPSLATMILGLMAGTVLRSDREGGAKLRWLLLAGAVCFAIVLPCDTTLWPWPLSATGANWSLCPAVKRIWTPSWAVFSSGWTFWILGAFFAVIDLWRWRAWAWPLVVVGVNSITMYCLSQLARPFARSALRTHLATLDQWCGWDQGAVYHLFGDFPYAPIAERLALLLVFWLVCVWLYANRILVRI
ncbi:MAG: hypothetical protein U0935_23060 [Pirellulales bacterium]